MRWLFVVSLQLYLSAYDETNNYFVLSLQAGNRF
jgi:hypothetical protein